MIGWFAWQNKNTIKESFQNLQQQHDQQQQQQNKQHLLQQQLQQQQQQKQLKRHQSNHKKCEKAKRPHYESESENEDSDQNNNEDYIDRDYSDELKYSTGEEIGIDTSQKSVKKPKNMKTKTIKIKKNKQKNVGVIDDDKKN